MDKRLLDVLACPTCKGPLTFANKAAELICRGCRVGFPIRDEIPVMLEEEAREIPMDELSP